MQLDGYYSVVLLCPQTKKPVSWSTHMHSLGVCPHCGDASRSTTTHAIKVSGKWLCGSWWERICGKRAVFIPKNELKDHEK